MRKIILNLLIVTIIALWGLLGCKKSDRLSISPIGWDELVDTVYSGGRVEFFLTDARGGWWMDDVANSSESNYAGLHFFDQHLIWNIEVRGEEGIKLNKDLDYSLIHPFYVERYWKSGLVERIEPNWRKGGFFVGWKLPMRQNIVVTLWKPSSLHPFNIPFTCPRKIITIFRPSPKDSLLREGKTFFVSFRFSEKESGEMVCNETWEYIFPNIKELTLGLNYYPDTHQASHRSQDGMLMKNSPISDAKRDFSSWQKSFHFVTSDYQLNKALEWCRVNLMKLLVFDKDNNVYLLCGLPDSPFSDVVHTALTVPLLVHINGSMELGESLLATALRRAQTGKRGSIVPNIITPDTSLYTLSLVPSYWIWAMEKLRSDGWELSGVIDSSLFLNSYYQTLNILKESRWIWGLWDGGTQISIGGRLDRQRRGGTIDSQYLFAYLRQWMRRHHLYANYTDSLPPQLLTGSPPWADPLLPSVVFTPYGDLPQPLASRYLEQYFHYKPRKIWFDSIIMDSISLSFALNKGKNIIPVDTIPRCYIPLTLHWVFPEDQKLAQELLIWAQKSGLLSDVGLKISPAMDDTVVELSLLEKENERKQTQKEDLLFEESFSDEALIWTVGELGDLFRMSGEFSMLEELLYRLIELVYTDVWGALPEVIDVNDLMSYQVRLNGVSALSCAEFIRVVGNDFVNVRRKGRSLLQIKAYIPNSWLPVKLNFRYDHQVVTLLRLDKRLWNIKMEGTEETMALFLEEIIPPDMSITGTTNIPPLKWLKAVPFKGVGGRMVWEFSHNE